MFSLNKPLDECIAICVGIEFDVAMAFSSFFFFNRTTPLSSAIPTLAAKRAL
jgi:hypothetical protein